MKLVKTCPVCGSSVRDGDFGEALWICNDQNCPKGNPNWPFQEKLNPYNEEYKDLNNKLNKFKHFDLIGGSGQIILDEAHFIGEGSGKIKIGLNQEVDFYVENQKVIYKTDNSIVLNFLKGNRLDERIKIVLDLNQKRYKIISEVIFT